MGPLFVLGRCCNQQVKREHYIQTTNLANKCPSDPKNSSWRSVKHSLHHARKDRIENGENRENSDNFCTLSNTYTPVCAQIKISHFLMKKVSLRHRKTRKFQKHFQTAVKLVYIDGNNTHSSEVRIQVAQILFLDMYGRLCTFERKITSSHFLVLTTFLSWYLLHNWRLKFGLTVVSSWSKWRIKVLPQSSGFSASILTFLRTFI